MTDASPKDPKIINVEFAEPEGKKDIQEAGAARKLSGNSTNNLSMEVKVASPFTTYFSGKAFSLSAVNATGPFDVLPKHHNFISLLQACTLIIRTTTGDEQKINIAGGLIHVKADKTVVFLDI